MYNLDLFIIAIYCFIEDDLYPAFCKANGKLRRAGFDPGLSDAECLTIEIVGHFLGYSSQKKLYEQMREHFKDWFPTLKDRPAFVRQCANLWHVKVWMQQMIVAYLQGHQAPCQVIDTLPLPICKLARRQNRKIFRTEPVFEFPTPSKGFCAAKSEAYFGFKGGLRITDYGLILHAPILKAYGHDKNCREALMDGTMGETTVLADAAFMDLDWQKRCFDTYRICIKTPLKSNMKENPQRTPFILPKAKKATRRLVETVYAQLTERLHIARMKVRDAWHLLNLWHTKILTHTMCVFLNIINYRDPLDFDGLVKF